mgnify:CR=1 FL=1
MLCVCCDDPVGGATEVPPVAGAGWMFDLVEGGVLPMMGADGTVEVLGTAAL